MGGGKFFFWGGGGGGFGGGGVTDQFFFEGGGGESPPQNGPAGNPGSFSFDVVNLKAVVKFIPDIGSCQQSDLKKKKSAMRYRLNYALYYYTNNWEYMYRRMDNNNTAVFKHLQRI